MFCAWVAAPVEALAAIIDADDVHVTVLIDVQCQVRIVIIAPTDLLHFTKAMRGPLWGLVPPGTADDVELAILIDVDGSGRTELGVGVEQVFFKTRVSL